jgi:hAT family C-terminal dimerisation region
MLPIMASSVSSERAFSSAGITITKRRNRLKPDIVEALQFLKCTYHRDLLFREEPSTQFEVDESGLGDVEDFVENGLGETRKAGWDTMVEDLVDDEDFVDHDEDDVFMQDIV